MLGLQALCYCVCDPTRNIIVTEFLTVQSIVNEEIIYSVQADDTDSDTTAYRRRCISPNQL